jgi:hypothetical protein
LRRFNHRTVHISLNYVVFPVRLLFNEWFIIIFLVSFFNSLLKRLIIMRLNFLHLLMWFDNCNLSYLLKWTCWRLIPISYRCLKLMHTIWAWKWLLRPFIWFIRCFYPQLLLIRRISLISRPATMFRSLSYYRQSFDACFLS